MTPERLDAIEARSLDIPPPYGMSRVAVLQVDVLSLVIEVRRLRKERDDWEREALHYRAETTT